MSGRADCSLCENYRPGRMWRGEYVCFVCIPRTQRSARWIPKPSSDELE